MIQRERRTEGETVDDLFPSLDVEKKALAERASSDDRMEAFEVLTDFGNDVDYAAERASSPQRRARASDDLHLFDVIDPDEVGVSVELAPRHVVAVDHQEQLVTKRDARIQPTHSKIGRETVLIDIDPHNVPKQLDQVPVSGGFDIFFGDHGHHSRRILDPLLLPRSREDGIFRNGIHIVIIFVFLSFSR